jgi:hypothetical protein
MLLTDDGTVNVPSAPEVYVQVTVAPLAAQLDGSASVRACAVPDSAANGRSAAIPAASSRQPE